MCWLLQIHMWQMQKGRCHGGAWIVFDCSNVHTHCHTVSRSCIVFLIICIFLLVLYYFLSINLSNKGKKTHVCWSLPSFLLIFPTSYSTFSSLCLYCYVQWGIYPSQNKRNDLFFESKLHENVINCQSNVFGSTTENTSVWLQLHESLEAWFP